jgi:hypothetical protein
VLVPHLGWDDVDAGEAGEGRASGKSVPEPATAEAAAGDLIAVRRRWETGAGRVEYSSRALSSSEPATRNKVRARGPTRF